MTFSLQPASTEDAPSLARVHWDAFANDPLLYLMYGPPGDMKGLIEWLQESLTTDPTTHFVKAVDDTTNETVGWSLWKMYHDGETHTEDARVTVEKQKTAPETAVSPEAYIDYHAAVHERREKWVGGKPAAILQALVVLPKHQGRGIGTALVNAGLEQAKNSNLPAWLEASDVGFSVYKKCGFRDVGDPIEMDLSKYGGDGVVTTVCMLHES